MQASEALKILRSLNPGENTLLIEEDASYLEGLGIISRLSSDEYMQLRGEIPSRIGLEKFIEGQTKYLDAIKAQADKKARKQESGFKLKRKKKLQEKQQEVQQLHQEVEQVALEIQNAQEKLGRIKVIENQIPNYRFGPVGYVRISEGSQRLVNHLKAAQIDNQTLEQFNAELEAVVKAIWTRYSRFKEMQNMFIEEGFQNDKRVINAALCMSGTEESIETVFNRSSIINNYLFNNKWEGYDRLPIVAAVAIQPGRIDNLQKNLEKMYLMMVNNNYSKSYATWLKAAAILQISNRPLRERFSNFRNFQAELQNFGWTFDTLPSCIIAANLARISHNYESTAAEFNNIESEIEVETGQESGYAALILMGSNLPRNALLERFQGAKEGLTRHGWDWERELYPVASTLALLPGSVEESVLFLKEIKQTMEADGLVKHTYRALKILSESYQFLEHVPDYIFHSEFYGQEQFKPLSFINFIWSSSGFIKS